MTLAGKSILVTGATGGIGRPLVKILAAKGALPIIHYSRRKDDAEALLDQISGKGTIVQADLSKPEEARELWRRAEDKVGDIYGLVNNAGIRSEVTVDADPSAWAATWEREFRVNFFAAADLCKEAIRHFIPRNGGRIISIASRAGQRGYAADAMPYGASKAALINLSRSIARSFGANGIISVAIAPGWVRTEMVEGLLDRVGEEVAVADIPIARMADPQEIAELVAFALQPSQVSMNGATIDVNGGSYIR
jgi:NAD(P)-dependent dehydrogenase (short-subunit alcohol dehydrogenase family)